MTAFETLTNSQKEEFLSLLFLLGRQLRQAINKKEKFQKVRAALHRDVRAISAECCHLLGLDITKEAMDIVAELVYAKIPVYGTDLEAFAKHAKRSVINAEDVKLLVRRNPSLKSHLNSLPSANPVAIKEKRRKTMPVTKQRTTPTKTTVVTKTSPLTTTKEPSVATPTDEAEKMVVDDAIDLTFDD